MTYARTRVATIALSVVWGVLLGIAPSHAQVSSDYTWVGTDGYWSDGQNWSPLGPPPDESNHSPVNAYLTQSDATNRTVTLNSYVQLWTGKVVIDSTGSGTMNLSIQEGASGAINMQVGRGTVTQTGGELYFVGNGLTIAGGTYNLGGGTLISHDLSDGQLSLGGSATFNQTGGSVRFGDINVGANATYNLGGGEIGPNHSMTIDGVFNQTGGTVHGSMSGGAYLINGTYNLNNGTFSSSNIFGIALGGTMNQAGGQWEAAGIRHVDISPGGTYNLSGGSFHANGLLNAGTINYSGGSFRVDNVGLGRYEPATPPGTLVNNGTVNLSGRGTRTIEGDVLNNGTFKTTNTSAVYTGTFTNNGAYLSDPAIQRFNNLTIGQTGYLQGGLADFFLIGGNFVNSSTMKTDWNTSLAYLGFVDGTTSLHDFALAGTDYGATLAGYKDNFAWGVLDLVGDYLRLTDGNEAAGGALYAGVILGLQTTDYRVTNITGMDGFDFYYVANLPGNEYLHGWTYDLTGGGHLIPVASQPVPEPSTLLLLGSGLAGLGGMTWRRHRRA